MICDSRLIGLSHLFLMPLFALCFPGNVRVVINASNIFAAMYHHDRHSRPSLDAACKQYLDRQVDQLKVHTVIPLLRLLDHFGVADLRSKCVEWMTSNTDKFPGCVRAHSLWASALKYWLGYASKSSRRLLID